jgi:peptide/nickel transport system permease protein
LIPIHRGVVAIPAFHGQPDHRIFGIPLGSYTIDAINSQDFAVVRAMVFLGSVLHRGPHPVPTDMAYTLSPIRGSVEKNDGL